LITPEMLAKSGTEAAHQSAVFCWAACAELRGLEAAEEFCLTGEYPKIDLAELFPAGSRAIPELHWLHSSTQGAMFGDNATSRAIRGGKLKAQGMKSGVADIFWPLKRGIYSGLYIEQKKPAVKAKKAESKGGLSNDQIAFRDFVLSQGFGWAVSYSWVESKNLIVAYYNWKA
jgi:hypothetical protein